MISWSSTSTSKCTKNGQSCWLTVASALVATASAPILRASNTSMRLKAVSLTSAQTKPGSRPSRSPICTTCASGTSGAGTPGHVGHQRIATPGGQRQVHAGHRAHHGPGVIISRMAEIAVSVDMDERKRALTAAARRARRAAPRRSPPTTSGNWPCAAACIDMIGEFEIEAPERMAVAQQRTRLRLGVIGRPRQIDDGGGTDRVDQPGIAQRLRRPPCARLVAGPERAQAEIAGRTDQ